MKSRKNAKSNRVNHEFRLFGILGHPLAHSLSPRMQEAAFAAAGLKAYYLVLDLELPLFKQAMKGLSRFQVEGFNITVPYKEAVLPYLDAVLPEARITGAVNTVFRKNGRWMGANTDIYGFLASLRQEARFQPAGKTALILGAGGAARAVLYGLVSKRVKKIIMANRHPERAIKLIRDFKKKFTAVKFEVLPFEKKKISAAIENADLVVNATSVGLKRTDPLLLPASWFARVSGKKKLFFDLIYNPPATPFLKTAKQKGHKILNGTSMLVHQGAKAFEYWTGKKAPVNVMREALADALKEKKHA